MVNVLVPIVEKSEQFEKILNRLSNINNVRVQIGVCENEYENLKNKIVATETVSVRIFPNGTDREEIINAMQNVVVGTMTMIMRKPITMEEFSKFILQRKDVVTCAKPMGKIKAFIWKFWQKILKVFLGVRLYKGDTSVVLLGEELSSVLSQSGDLSFSTRVDRWKGIEQGTVETATPSVKTRVDKKNNLFLGMGIGALISVGILVSALICLFCKVNLIIGLMLACLNIIAVSLSFIMLIVIIFNNIVGKKKFDKAKEIKAISEE